jgi:glutamate formiminotransferase/formiminotetrahydrofolate cyclodeaminase
MRVTGSELVGLVPLDAMLAAGDHFLKAQGRTTAIPEADRIRMAVVSLGLEEIGEFDPATKIVEYRYLGVPEGLVTETIAGFTDVLSRDSAAPGGGSVAALTGALSAALSSMVASLTFAKQGMEDSKQHMESTGRHAQSLKDWFLTAVDRDTDAFNGVLTAIRLPRTSEDDRSARRTAMARANLEATLVPLEVLERSIEALEMALITARDGNPNSVTDAGVAGACAVAAAEGASLNVRINLDGLDGDPSEIIARHDRALAQARDLGRHIAEAVEAHLAVPVAD